MAPPFRVEAVLPAPAHTYFLEKDSAAFRSLLSKVLKIGQLEFKELWREGTSSYVRMITKPEFGSWVPKGVANQLNSSQLEFHDIIEYNPAHIASPPYKIFVRTESPFLGDKLDVRMTLTIEELEGGQSCRQVLEGHIRVRMFGLGRIVEGIVKDSLQNTYKKLPEIVRRWQLFREEALRSGDGRQLLLGRPPVGCEVQWIRQEVVQILKEVLPADGSATPISSLCPVPGSSEASNDNPADRLRLHKWHQQQQQQGVGGMQEPAEKAGAAVGELQGAVQPGERHQEQQLAEVEPVGAAELLGTGRPGMHVALSGPSATVYYDARECLRGDGPCSAVSSRLGDMAGMPSGSKAEGSAPAEELEEAASLLARSAHHRRGLSSCSATSTDTPTTAEDGASAQQQPMSRRYWRRFNRDYGEWENYWDTVGVAEEQEEEEGGQAGGGGVVARAVRAAEEMLRTGYYSTSILVALFLMRNGWLRVVPDANADPHDEGTRQHSGHRHAPPHRHTHSTYSSVVHHSSSGAEASSSHHDDEANEKPVSPARAQSLSRVAAEVQKRLVSGSRAVAKAPVRAVVAAGTGLAAAGTSMRYVGMSWGDLFARPARAKSTTDICEGGSIDSSTASHAAKIAPMQLSEQAQMPSLHAAAAGAQAGYTMGQMQRQAKALSLDAAAAAEAQRIAAAAIDAHVTVHQRQSNHASAGMSPRKVLQRRPSNMAAMAAMASMERTEHRLRAPVSRPRFSCFTACSRAVVKD